MKKILRFTFLTLFFSFLFNIICFAAWMEDDKGFWWKNDDGSFPAGEWQWIDGNNDGIAECYYFDDSGYMLSDTVTPDSYRVDSSGAWVSDGEVQTIKVSDFVNKDESYSIAELKFVPAGDFSGAAVMPQSDGSISISSTKLSNEAVIMTMDLDSDEELRNKIETAEALGVDFNSPELQSEFNDIFTATFSSEFGTPESINDKEFNTGSWRVLHYGEDYYMKNGMYVDILVRFYNKTMYGIILGGEDPVNVEAFMNECIFQS